MEYSHEFHQLTINILLFEISCLENSSERKILNMTTIINAAINSIYKNKKLLHLAYHFSLIMVYSYGFDIWIEAKTKTIRI